MKPVSYSRYLPLTLLLGSLGLAGCGGAISLPDSVSSKQVQGPPVSMKVLGGHAPLVGTHVYLLQPGISGYGSAAISLLGNNGATSANGYTISTNGSNSSVPADPNIPVGAKYVTTDMNGDVSFTGAYACTVGQPVYSYSYGGSSLTTAPTSYTFPTTTSGTTTTTTQTPVSETIIGITVSGSNAGTNNDGNQGNATYTITLNAPLPLTKNQTVNITGLSGNLSILNGAQTATAATTTPNTTFTIKATAVYGSYNYSYYVYDFGGLLFNKQNGTYYETVANGAYTQGTGPTGDDGGGDDNGPTPAYDFTVTSGTPSTGTGLFDTAGMATATEPVTTTTSTPGTTTTYAATTNPTVQMAILGICPSSGNFSTTGNGAIQFVYSNEVSTIAAAYVFQPFTVASNNNAWDIGTSGTTQALLGIANAASTAAQLYAIQGNAQISGTEDGEGHIANYQTQGGTGGITPNQGTGVVPQATLDTLANILAACIDATEGTDNSVGAPCVKLFDTATSDGLVAGTTNIPTDTATAAINIARYPAGNNSGAAGTVATTYVADLYGIPSGTVPYAPNLTTQPNDWTIAINYPETAISGYGSATNNSLGSAESLAVDNIGQIWITAQAADDIVRWSPLGAQNVYDTLTYIPGYVSLDGSNNAWTGNADSTSSIYEAGSNGVFNATYGSGFNKAYVVVTDNNDDVFTFANTSNTGSNYEMFEYPSGSTTSTTATQINISPSVITATNNIGHGAIDASGDLWITSETSNQIARISQTGVQAFTPIVTAQQPEFPAIDHAGNAWIAVQATDSEIYVVPPTGANPTILTSDTTGAEFTSTFGSAVDGNGNVWFVNRCGNYGVCGTTPGENSLIEINGTSQTAISPPTNYVPEAQYGSNASNTTLTPILDGSLNLAIDPSGNIWITNYTGNGVVEVIGAAAPIVTPLSVAAGTNKLGEKP